MRMLPSAFDLTHNIPLRTDMTNAATRELIGRSLLDYRLLDAEQYGQVLQFSREVFNVLQSWGWLSQHMLDVHSFLRIVTSRGYGDGSSGPDEGGDHERSH